MTADEWEGLARAAEAQAEQYREMGRRIRAMAPDHDDDSVNEQVARLVRLGQELDEAAAYNWAQAHSALTGR